MNCKRKKKQTVRNSEKGWILTVNNKEIYAEIQKIVRKDLPMYMLVYPSQNVVTKKEVKNFKLDPVQAHRLYGVSIEG